MDCHCGCKQPANRNFLPGHDQKLRSELEKQVGSLLNLERLVALNRSLIKRTINVTDFEREVRELFRSASA